MSDHVHTPSDTVPDFGTAPTHSTAKGKRWSSSGTWSAGQVPDAGSVVEVAEPVLYDVASDAKIKAVVVRPGGALVFAADWSTKLVVQHLQVLEGGSLLLADALAPLQPQFKCEVVIADAPLDTAKDPKQYGNGLLVFGKCKMYGAPKDGFLRLAVEPKAGDTVLTLERAPAGWRAGDRLALPRTDSHYYTQYPPEEVTVASVDGYVVTLAAPLQHPHPGARDGDGKLDFLPHAANLTRNVVVRSENPLGTRGHTMFLHRADVDLRHVQFKDLGRTTGAPLDNTVIDAQGNVTHLGTNQVGRYAVHCHHILGAPNPTNTGWQYRFEGCVVDRARKWGIAVHNSHYGLIKGNVVYEVETDGFATEDGSESHNRFEGNFVLGFEKGQGCWLNGIRNSFVGNVAAGSRTYNGAGFYAPPNLDAGKVFAVPKARGLDPAAPGNAETFYWVAETFQEFRGNEAYSVALGFWADHRHGGKDQGGHLVKDFSVWASYGNVNHGVAVAAYDTDGTTFDGLVARGAGVRLLSDFVPTVVKNADVQGPGYGIWDMSPGVGVIVEDSFFRCDTSAVVLLTNSFGAAPFPAGPVKTTVYRNVKHAALPGKPLIAFEMWTTSFGQPSLVPVLENRVEVYAHQGNASDNFRLYFDKQKADVAVPSEAELGGPSPYVKAAPEPGLTNAQCWAKYGLAWAGAVAPANAAPRPEILYGLGGPL
jgi:hypothetical protein